jgi:hypothetical protein
LHLGADFTAKSKLRADDPRVLRVKQLKQQIKFNQEKFIAYDQTPLSNYDLYMRKLHNSSSNHGTTIAQKSTQSNEDDREIETQTDEIEVKHEEAQFQCGDDDTVFFNLISGLNSFHSKEERRSVLLAYEPEGAKKTSTGSLSRFLRKTSKV